MGHPEDNAFVEGSRQTDDEELHMSRFLVIRNEKDFMKRGILRQKVRDRECPHQVRD